MVRLRPVGGRLTQWREYYLHTVGVTGSNPVSPIDWLWCIISFYVWKGMLVQYTGRLNRVFYGKKEIRVDEKVPVLARMYGRRLKGHKSLGFTAW